MKDTIPSIGTVIFFSISLLLAIFGVLELIFDQGLFLVFFSFMVIFSIYSAWQLHRAKGIVDQVHKDHEKLSNEYKNQIKKYDQKKEAFESGIHEANYLKRVIKTLKIHLENETPRSKEADRITKTLLAQLKDILGEKDNNE